MTFFTAFRVYHHYLTNFVEEAFINRNVLVQQQNSGLWMLVHLLWGAGIIAILIHILRLLEWRQRHPVIKGFLIFILIEGILEAIYYNVFFAQLFLNQDLNHYYDFVYTTGIYPFTDLWFFHLIPYFNPSAAVILFLGIQALLLAVAYISIKPVANSKEISITRAAWIFYGLIVGIRWILNLPQFLQLPIFQDNMAFWMNFVQLAPATEFLEFLATFVLMLVVARYPEALLITEYQITKAAKLYQFIDTIESSSRFPNLISSEEHLVDYIRSLPADIRELIP